MMRLCWAPIRKYLKEGTTGDLGVVGDGNVKVTMSPTG
jgi:hypothetical protein